MDWSEYNKKTIELTTQQNPVARSGFKVSAHTAANWGHVEDIAAAASPAEALLSKKALADFQRVYLPIMSEDEVVERGTTTDHPGGTSRRRAPKAGEMHPANPALAETLRRFKEGGCWEGFYGGQTGRELVDYGGQEAKRTVGEGTTWFGERDLRAAAGGRPYFID